MNSARDWISLSLAPGLGPVAFWHLVNLFGSPTTVLEMDWGGLKQHSGLGKRQINGLQETARLREAADSELDRLYRVGGHAIISDDPCYPELLRTCVNPPPVLYVKGNKACLNTDGVAVVGSRAATGYGRRIAFTLGRDLAARGVTVVSGLATGIDAEAHAGSLDGGGTTIGVLGCGLDVIYPRTNTKLYQQVVERGVLVTEYGIGTKPEGFRFPARNRIIAGMCYGVVVVEAAKKSGSLITVQHALDEGREVFAIPGQVDSVKSGGTHWLLQQGASLALSASDIIDSLDLETREATRVEREDVELDGDTKLLFSLVENYPKQRDELIERSGLSPAKISEHLLLLELEGLIELLPGDQVRRVVA